MMYEIGNMEPPSFGYTTVNEPKGGAHLAKRCTL